MKNALDISINNYFNILNKQKLEKHQLKHKNNHKFLVKKNSNLES